jgi:hypothetical protein
LCPEFFTDTFASPPSYSSQRFTTKGVGFLMVYRGGRFLGVVGILSLISAVSVLSGCNHSPSGTQQAQELPNKYSGGAKTGTGGCHSDDPDQLCIGLKIVAYQDSAGAPALSRADADTVISGVNGIWAGCGIAFQIDAYETVKPEDYGLAYNEGSQSETPAIRQAFSDNQTFLIAVTGPWNSNYIAWAQMPGTPPYGVVIDRTYATDPLTVGHELGHYLGLDHSVSGNLMYYQIYANADALTAEQCASAREVAQKNWAPMLR